MRATPLLCSAPLVALLIIAQILSPVLSSVTVEEAGLRIVFPPGHDERIDFAMADFGEPRYGGRLNGDLYYPTSDPAQMAVGQHVRKCFPEDCQYACQPFEETRPEKYELPHNKGRLNVMLADRGPKGSTTCFFMLKAWNAQRAGAHALIIVDYEDDSLATLTVPDNEEFAAVLPNLTIAVGMVNKRDGQKLKDLLKLGPTSVALNWTNIVPRTKKVEWELFTNAHDWCGTVCQEQRNFLATMGPIAKQLEKLNLTSFSPHYVFWSCPVEYLHTADCHSQCIFNGTYCATDPDQDLTYGYTGVDVLMMNVRELCFFRHAKANAMTWLWWDYAHFFSGNCTMDGQKYTAECAAQIFQNVGGADLDGGLSYWNACINNVSAGVGPSAENATIELLEQELIAQRGGDGETAVTILPTVRINRQQYRGTMDVPGVVRALCSAFPFNQEPALCNDKWVSEDECEADGVGALNCRVKASAGATHCTNTFSSYQCDCGVFWLHGKDPISGDDTCEDVNECLATNIPLSNPECKCDRCACINTIGSYKCTGPLPNKCTPEYNNNGCWNDITLQQSACVDGLATYKRAVARSGEDPPVSYTSCKCPSGCFEGSGVGVDGCRLNCYSTACFADPNGRSYCQGEWGQDDRYRPGGASGGASKGDSFSFWVVLLSMCTTAGLMYAVYSLAHRVRAHKERNMLNQYMPLRVLEESGGGDFRPPVDYKPPAPVLEEGEMQQMVEVKTSAREIEK